MQKPLQSPPQKEGFGLRFFSFIVITYCIFILSACSHKDSLQTFNTYYYNAQEEKAFAYASNQAGSGDVLWNLQAGIAGFETQNPKTHEMLEKGETLFGQYEKEGLLGGTLDNVGSIIINENIKTYRGNIYEGVMFHYYKALNAMLLKDNALARVEFNRANDRQRRAKDYFYQDVQKALQEVKEDPNTQDRQLQNIGDDLLAQYSNLNKLSAYHGFINPAVSYVSALFFMLEGDYSKATDLYKEAFAISKSPTIKKDLEIIEERKKGKKQTYTWLIIEDGESIHKEEISSSLPINTGESIIHIGISLPFLTEGTISPQDYQVRNTQDTLKPTIATEVGDIDQVISNEFTNQIPFIVGRTLTSAFLKASTQMVLARELSSTGALVGFLYSMATNTTDIRISTALPKRVLAMQILNTQDFFLYSNHNKLYKVSFQCTTQEMNNEKQHNLIFLCPKHDNILHFRIKGENSNYRILKGGQYE